jgi:hypothetical protein
VETSVGLSAGARQLENRAYAPIDSLWPASETRSAFLGSSTVERSAVNRNVRGSNPCRGANNFNGLGALAIGSFTVYVLRNAAGRVTSDRRATSNNALANMPPAPPAGPAGTARGSWSARSNTKPVQKPWPERRPQGRATEPGAAPRGRALPSGEGLTDRFGVRIPAGSQTVCAANLRLVLPFFVSNGPSAQPSNAVASSPDWA